MTTDNEPPVTFTSTYTYPAVNWARGTQGVAEILAGEATMSDNEPPVDDGLVMRLLNAKTRITISPTHRLKRW